MEEKHKLITLEIMDIFIKHVIMPVDAYAILELAKTAIITVVKEERKKCK